MQPHNQRERQVSPQEQSADRIRSMHDVFSDPCRCAILHYLNEREDSAAVSEVASRIDACREETGEESARAALLHGHVLAMVEFGLLSYDPTADTITIPDDVCVTVEPPWDDL